MAAKYAINTVRFFVQDTATGLGVAGLTVAGNSFTSIKLSQDGVLGADIKATITLVDEGAGWYNFVLTALQANYECISPVVVPATATYQAYGVTFYTSKIDNAIGLLALASTGTVGSVTLLTDPYGADNIPNGSIISIVGGTGIGQNRTIIGYNHTTKVVTVGRNWTTTPDGTSIILIKQLNTARIDASQNVYSVDANGNAIAPASVLPAVAAGAKGGLPITDASTGLILTGFGGGTVKNDLVDAPNTTAVTAMQNGLSKPTTPQTITSNSDITAIKGQTDKLAFDLISTVNYLKVTVYGYIGSLLTGTAALIRAAVDKFFNVSTPTGTVNSLPDAVAGATNGLSVVGSAMALTNVAFEANRATSIQSSADAAITANAAVAKHADITGLNNLSSAQAQAACATAIAADPGLVEILALLGYRLEISIADSKAYIFNAGGTARLWQRTLTDKDGAPITADTTGPINGSKWIPYA